MHISAKDVRYRYRRGPALSGVTVEIPAGVCGVLGPNGAGKTTLLRLLTGILRPRAGTLRVGGHETRTVRGRRAVRRLAGYLPEAPGPHPHLSVRECLDYAALLNGDDDAEHRRHQVGRLMDRLDLTVSARARVGELSTGARQRVGVAQALVGDPRLLVLDEPTAGLDPLHRRQLRDLVAELGRDITVVLSTHVLGDVASVCSQVVLLRAGGLVLSGTVDDLARHAPDGGDLEQGYVALVGAGESFSPDP
ncbi:ATP-binding cassette domain-containing protein [Spiractinospora alimapuensis]|uniref:ABC transporter ATP-binding protein n=1 Tax=Spiractinospora alimapuensis TaxID=2820884 RepID=UPI001F1FA63B|nr:ATP-binding cassette domain-containing protein [Spiractinospora alimapuensis]QVQ54552.1 ATP-binding cassette domain-containing protein [Spiractinospora alimapuensis]